MKLEFEELILGKAPLEVSGFSPDEVDQLVLGDELEMVEEGQLEPELHAIATSRLGDIYTLGVHRLICGSSTDPATFNKIMAGDPPARFVLTDEPYNVKIAGNVSGKTGKHKKSAGHGEFVMASGEMSNARRKPLQQDRPHNP